MSSYIMKINLDTILFFFFLSLNFVRQQINLARICTLLKNLTVFSLYCHIYVFSLFMYVCMIVCSKTQSKNFYNWQAFILKKKIVSAVV